MTAAVDNVAARERAAALLAANHVFPGDFTLSVIARNDDEVAAAVVLAIAGGALGAEAARGHERRPSAGGKYVSHRVSVFCRSADDVLDLYARLRAVDGVITAL